MPVEAVVVDASALAALLFGEPAGPKVAALLEGRALFAPTLLRYEVASVCLKKEREEPHKKKELRLALSLLSGLRIQEVQVSAEGMVAVAEETSLTAYDAGYLWLARELRVRLVTLDGRLIAASAENG